MKRLSTILGITLLTTLGFNSTATAQVEQGNIIIDPYIGAPTGNVFWGGEVTGTPGYKTIGLPIAYGGRFEYMASDNFGVGFDVNYVVSGYEYTEEDYYYDSETGQFSDATYSYTAKKLRAMVRLNYHFVQTDALDAYFGVGAGYRNVTRSWDYDGEPLVSQEKALIPVAFKLAFGARYYFTDNIGAMLELGLGGGTPLNLGLSIKI